LNGISPRGAQRGTDAVVVFGGQNLNDAPEVMAYYPGITVTKTEVLSRDALRVTMKIAPDCRLGEHGFRVRTSSGVSDFRTFWVGALPVVDEKEPNSEFATPQPIPLNSTVHGSVANEDVDYFQVECKKGQRLSVEVEGMRLGDGFWDPFVAILNDKRFELATSDDSPLTGQDGGCSVVVPADGKYVVMVRESAFGAGPAYRLHVGTFPRPTAVVPAGGPPGSEVEVRFLGDPAGPIAQKVKLPAAGDPHFRVHCETPDGVHPAGIKFRVIGLLNVTDTQAAAAPPGAVVGPAPGAFNGVIEKPGETKFFRFAAKKGQVFDAHCYARRLGSMLDPVMHLAVFANNTLGQYLAGVDDAVGPDSYFRFTAPADGEYCLYVHDHLKKGGPDYFFRVELTPVAAATSTGVPKVDGNNVSNQDRQNAAVPRGNRYAFLAMASRADWGGPATVSFDRLPAGVTAAADPVDPGLPYTPVVLEAKADAPLGGVLADLRAVPADPNVKATSRTDLDVNFCIGLNNTPFHRHVVDRVAVAVTDAVPFSVEVVEPRAPVVQNGSMNIKVVAKRSNGFKGPITVIPLFAPPNVGITGATVIPENATEALVYCNAAPNAAARKWKTAFLATAGVTTTIPNARPNDPTTTPSGGPVWVSTQLFTLEVYPPFVSFAQERAAVEQGGKTQLFCKVAVNAPFDGKAKAQVVGLPAKVTAPPVEFTKDAKEVVFDIATDKTSPAGKHGVFCQVVIERNGEPVTHNVGGNELRIDVPLPPKAAPAAPPQQAAKPATPPPAAPPQQKRLSRLEQLRQEQEQREKEAKGGTPAAPPKPEPKK
jgi:hypothetical protein